MYKMKKIVMCGGGTAGHIMPNIALFPALKNKYQIHYIGEPNSMEYGLVSKYPYVTYWSVASVKFIRKFTLKNLAIPFKLYKAIMQCKKILKEINPSVIFSKGGYVSVPVVIAGAMLHIPIVAHESDYSMGLANKIIYRKCSAMCFSFKALTLKYDKKGIYTGSPIRPTLNVFHPENMAKLGKFDEHKPNVLFVGGSLGAKAINDVVQSKINTLTKRYNIVHIVGNGNMVSERKSNYVQLEFLNNIQDAFAWADVVVSRAGSNVIFELLYLCKPMILIPLPKDVSRGDQILNAYDFEKNGYAKVLLQSELNEITLSNTIEKALQDKSGMELKMKKANKDIGNNLIIEQIDKFAKKE